jgi:hypothetical protein
VEERHRPAGNTLRKGRDDDHTARKISPAEKKDGPSDAGPVYGLFRSARDAMNAALIERAEEVDLVMTALVAGENPLLVGPPGTAKSLLLDSLMAWMGGRKFSHQGSTSRFRATRTSTASRRCRSTGSSPGRPAAALRPPRNGESNSPGVITRGRPDGRSTGPTIRMPDGHCFSFKEKREGEVLSFQTAAPAAGPKRPLTDADLPPAATGPGLRAPLTRAQRGDAEGPRRGLRDGRGPVGGRCPSSRTGRTRQEGARRSRAGR